MLQPNDEVSDRSQPPLTFNLSLSEPAGSGSLHLLVGRTIPRGKALPERMPLGLDQPEGTISEGGQRVTSAPPNSDCCPQTAPTQQTEYHPTQTRRILPRLQTTT